MGLWEDVRHLVVHIYLHTSRRCCSCRRVAVLPPCCRPATVLLLHSARTCRAAEAQHRRRHRDVDGSPEGPLSSEVARVRKSNPCEQLVGSAVTKRLRLVLGDGLSSSRMVSVSRKASFMRSIESLRPLRSRTKCFEQRLTTLKACCKAAAVVV